MINYYAEYLKAKLPYFRKQAKSCGMAQWGFSVALAVLALANLTLAVLVFIVAIVVGPLYMGAAGLLSLGVGLFLTFSAPRAWKTFKEHKDYWLARIKEAESHV